MAVPARRHRVHQETQRRELAMSHRPICRGCGANRAHGEPHKPGCPKANKREEQK